MRRTSIVAVLTIALVTASGCAQAGSGEQPPQPNWKNPIHGRVEVSLAAAQAHMPFRLRSLPGFPRPVRIVDTPGLEPRDRIVVLQYRTSSGPANVYEETPQVSAREFRKVIGSWTELNGQPGTSGTVTAVKISGKYPAALTTASDGARSDIRWIEAGVEYLISGPSLTKRACIRFATELAS